MTKLNIGCGAYPFAGWTNVEQDATLPAEIHARVPPIPCDDASCDDIYAGHFLEHLSHDEGHAFLLECYRCLTPGGRLGIVVPDTRAVLGTWLGQVPVQVEFPTGVSRDVSDLDEVCRLFLYSTVQDSPHLWSYDRTTLARALTRAGFEVVAQIDRMHDPRIPVGAWYQCGLDARKPGVAA